MGFRICYIAAQMSLDDVVEGLSFELGEKTDEQPFDDDWIAHQQETGFTILWSGDEGYAFRQSKRLAELSNRACVYSAQISETVMCSDAVCYENGKEHWRIMHQGFDGQLEKNTSILGAALPEFEQEMERQRAAAAAETSDDVDYFFDVPVNVLQKKIGFRYDQMLSLSNGMQFFEVVSKPEVTARKGFWPKLLGK